MKWFKHQSNASQDEKIAKLEERFGLVGYAAFFKLLELCASNWDEVSDPVFSFSLKQIQNKLRMKSKQTDLVLGLLSELNLFQITKCENNVIINACKMAEVKKKCQKKDQVTSKQSPSYKEKDKDKEKEKEREKEVSSPPPSIIETGDIPQSLMLTLTTRFNYPENIVREVAEDAWLKFLVNQDPDKKWDRYLTYYFINEKESIRNFLSAKGKAAKEKTVDDWMAQIIADDEAEQEALRNQRGGLSDV